MSFVSYLTEVRLQHALSLLNTTDDKTYVIAGKVGYTEPNYFSYVFKKRFGVSPFQIPSSRRPHQGQFRKACGKIEIVGKRWGVEREPMEDCDAETSEKLFAEDQTCL